jgi:DNA-binding transcriptional regulator YiaG
MSSHDSFRALCQKLAQVRGTYPYSQGQQEAARALHVHPRTVRKWVAGDSSAPWAYAELLKRIIDDEQKTNKKTNKKTGKNRKPLA